MKQAFRVLPALILIGILFSNTFAITWFPREFTCPIDNEKNTFMVIGSYGSYIYSYPSKYQWLFFPNTDSPTYYLCKKCHLATYMWDFDKLPKEKLAELKNVLAGVKVSKPFKEYTEVPITERLEIMEKVYTVLDKDEDWWGNFYRTEGYHYGKAGDAARAAEARKKSLAIIQKQLKSDKNDVAKKLLYYIGASLKHFLSDDTGALEDLQKALETKYEKKDAKPEEMKNAEEGINSRIREYIERIKSESNKPRMFDKYTRDEH
jgi:hypothetical protein